MEDKGTSLVAWEKSYFAQKSRRSRSIGSSSAQQAYKPYFSNIFTGNITLTDRFMTGQWVRFGGETRLS